jgi:20S proteasome subunit alpha 6
VGNNNNNANNGRGPPIPQPSFQALPPAPQIGPQGSFNGGPPSLMNVAQPMARGGAPGMGGGRGGGVSVRGGGGPPLRGAKSGFIPNRGGGGGGPGAGGMRGGRGGSMMNVGGGGDARNGAPVRGGPRGRGGFGGTRRGGGSFGGPNAGSFRGGRGGHHGARGPRADAQGAGSTPLGPSASFNAGAGKKDENRRTLTDFKIVGFELPDLGWSWGVMPRPVEVAEKLPDEAEAATVLEESGEPAPSLAAVDDTPAEDPVPAVPLDDASESGKEAALDPPGLTVPGEPAPADAALERSPTVSVAETAIVVPEAPTRDGPPPARLRIYFYTPPSFDDAQPSVGATGWSWDQPDATRKGKRKKGEDEDEDDAELEEGRVRPRPPGEDHDRVSVAPSVQMRSGSVAPSVAETMSEGDWLMAGLHEPGLDGEHDFDEGGEASAAADPAEVMDGGVLDEKAEPSEPLPNGHVDEPSVTDAGKQDPALSVLDGQSPALSVRIARLVVSD